MGIGVSVFLIAVGAILTFAIGADVVDVVNIDVVGIILMIAGVVGLVVTLLMYGRDRDRYDRGTVVEERRVRDRDVYY